MITVLTGENSFEIAHALEQIVAEFDGAVEQIDGAELQASQLPDLLMGGTLFAAKRLVVIKQLSDNKPVWTDLGEWLGRVSDDIHLVIIDPKPDKRTKTYKDLKKTATLREFAAWNERDIAKAEAWVAQQAAQQNITIDRPSVQALVGRTGVDQWRLYHDLQKLSAVAPITPRVVQDVIDASPSENVFNLFDAALKGDVARVGDMITTLRQTDDAYMVFGLLSGQAFQLAALAVADVPAADVAKDIGAHPFALSKLAPQAKRLGRVGARRIVGQFAGADDRLKSSGVDPWVVIGQTLVNIATQAD